MFWKSYMRSKNFLLLFTLGFIATLSTIVITLIFGYKPVRIALSVLAFIFFSLIVMLFSFCYKQQYEEWIPKYYIVYNNDNIKYYFIGYIDTNNGEISFSDDPSEAMLYISMKKINILIEILKNDYSLNEDNITIEQLKYKEAYNKWQTN